LPVATDSRAGEVADWADGLSEGVLLVASGRVSWLNAAAGEMLGVGRERAIGAPLIAVVRDHRLERVALDGAEDEVSVGGRVLRARPIPGGMALTDVSEQRRSKGAARALLAVLSHELRTPATTIRSAIDALHHDLGEEQRRRFLAHAQSECDRLVRLIEDLTVEAMPPRERRLELPRLVDRAAAILAPRLAERGVELRQEVPPLLVWADEDKLLQVLLNLLENAAVHGPAHAQVVLAAKESDAGETVAVRVRDRGEPLAAGDFAGLFEPHARGRRPRDESGGRSSGLGLYIVRSLVERWGGRVWGKPLADGNEFGFTVPSRPKRQS
jgi:signal transduction histidine kinase